jgi:lysophospholipase L1-like esterase
VAAWAVGLALVVALASTGCSRASGEPTTRPAGVSVAIVGDSITFLSTADIDQDLTAAGYDSTVVGRIGETAADVRGDVADAARRHPRIVLLELGTNDATRSATGDGSAADFEHWMQHYIDELPGACLIATTVTEHRPSATMNATAHAINSWIEVHFTHIVDWDAFEWAKRESGIALVKDDVHPNARGASDLAQLDLDAINQCGLPH